MATTLPKAKTQHLIVREIDGETLVYDMGRHAASCLSPLAAKVWRCCDGTTSVADIADALGEDPRAVWLALHQLNKSKLLVEEIALPPDMRTGKTRREIAGQLGLGAAVAAVSTIVMTTAAHASCLPIGASCTSNIQCCSANCVEILRLIPSSKTATATDLGIQTPSPIISATAAAELSIIDRRGLEPTGRADPIMLARC